MGIVDEDIARVCKANYGVSFPMFSKTTGVGDGGGFAPDLPGARDGEDVSGVQEVVAPSAVHLVLAGAAEQPVVPVVTEDGVAAVAVAQPGGQAGP